MFPTSAPDTRFAFRAVSIVFGHLFQTILITSVVLTFGVSGPSRDTHLPLSSGDATGAVSDEDYDGLRGHYALKNSPLPNEDSVDEDDDTCYC